MPDGVGEKRKGRKGDPGSQFEELQSLAETEVAVTSHLQSGDRER